MTICAAPMRHGPNKGLAATGTPAGATRHRRAGEAPCGECEEGLSLYNHRYYESNDATIRQRSRRWFEANRSRHAEAGRRWHSENPQYKRDWASAHPEVGRERRRRQRAIKAAALTIAFTQEQLDDRLSMFPGCWLCGGEADTVDHVIALAAGGPHVLSNLRPACRSCNSAKRDKDWREVAA